MKRVPCTNPGCGPTCRDCNGEGERPEYVRVSLVVGFETYKAIERRLSVRGLVGPNAIDGLMAKICEAIERGDSELLFDQVEQRNKQPKGDD